jgi:hypothetical protein
MRIPGFTAEAGLQRTAARWATGEVASAADREAHVVPQFCFTQGNTTTCCYCDAGFCFCHTVHRVQLM